MKQTNNKVKPGWMHEYARNTLNLSRETIDGMTYQELLSKIHATQVRDTQEEKETSEEDD